MSVARDPHIKGVVFGSVLKTLVVVRDSAFRGEVERAFEGEFAETWSHGGVLPAGWYSIAWYRELWRAIRSIDPDPELVREVGRVSLELDMRTYHRAIARMLSPTTLMRLAQRLFGRYFDTGEIVIVASERGRVHAKWTNIGGFDEALWMEHLAAAEHLIRLSEHDARLSILSGCSGDATGGEAEATW